MSDTIPFDTTNSDDQSFSDSKPSSAVQIPIIEVPESILAVDQQDAPSLASTLKVPETSPQFLSPPLPVTTTSHIFSLTDLLEEHGDLENLGPDVSLNDINVAPDGSYIETSSGPTAYLLKRRYDQLAGVGPSVCTPYTITAFVNQHGKSMYRIGHRGTNSAPAASAVDADDRLTESKSSSEASHSPRTQRRSRLSMHFLQPSMFAKPSIPPTSRPPIVASNTPSVSKKLRKTRSIPDMSSSEPTTISAPTYAVTGRGHSQSVTAMDIPRLPVPFTPYPPSRRVDAFAELMDWFNPSSNVSNNFSNQGLFRPDTSSGPSRSRATIMHPFGQKVVFDSPSLKVVPERIPPPRHLREMQSFESGRTARQHDSRGSLPNSDSPVPSSDTSGTAEEELSRPASAIHISTLPSPPTHFGESPNPPAQAEPDPTPSGDSHRLGSQYYTEVFNVLQTYRGLPLFEKLVPEFDNTNVIKLSLAADQSAAPRDDPRFVIWGDIEVEPETDNYHSKSRDSLTDVSSSNLSSSSVSKRRSSKVSKFKSPEASVVSLPKQGQRVLLAATIERWIAQLTSDLNYDELLNFFLTYRTYVGAVDLCHLFICRFHWALQEASSKQDETVRRIVRVRTFVAIRYWLLTFFTVDFITNRELRLLIADWLNTLIDDPILKKHSDATDIVKRLIKVAKECKRAHIRTSATSEKSKSPSEPKSSSDNEERPVNHLLGKSFAEAIRKLPHEDNESVLDLDFLPDEAKTEEVLGFPTDPANAHLTAGAVSGTVLSPNRPASLPLSSFNILQRTDHAPGPSTNTDLPFIANTAPVLLDHHHSALSRAFVRTIGRLGRWKRVLNHRSTVRPPNALGACGVGDQAFDLDLNVARDLLTVNGGVENYLRMVEPPTPRPNTSDVVVAPVESHSRHPSLLVLPPLPSVPPTPSVPLSTANIYPSQSSSSLLSHSNVAHDLTATTTLKTESPPLALAPLPGPSDPSPPPSFVESVSEADDVSPVPTVSLAETVPTDPVPTTAELHRLSPASFSEIAYGFREPDRPESFMSSSTDSFGAILTADGPLLPTFPGQHSQWGFDASIDDLEFSDTSSLPGEADLPAPPGLMRPARRLPNRRDFEFVRRSEVSSMGIVSNEYMRDSIASSTHSESSPSSSGVPPPIHRWQMKSLQRTFESMSNDGEDGGDVEAALRRLEGQINPKIQQEKAEKVDGWVRSLQERMQNGDYDYESSIFSEDDVEGFIDEVDPPTDDTDPESPPDLVVSSSETDDSYDNDDTDGMPRTPIPSQATRQLPLPPGLDPIPRLEPQKPPLEDAVPMEILQSRLLPSETAAAESTSPPAESILSSKFSTDATRSIHQSFVLGYPAEHLAEHFSMIDRELFMSVKFEELVTGEWMDCEEINVLDWAQYLKDRARWKAEMKFPEKTTALAAVRARFNLMVAFVVSEVVLTPPAERPIVVSKFLRIAWKCYSLSNFNTLAAIIMALKGDWVARAMRRQGWSRIGVFETRVFKDLKMFITVADNFKFMRQIVDSIVDAKPIEGSSHAASVVSGGDSQSGKGKASDSRPMVPTACIPFIGIYLSQLHGFSKLPALIDPTAPNVVVGIDPVTPGFDPPAHPEVFSALAPLPKSMHLEPLINVHKQRRIADVIKSLVAGQHLASRVQFSIDKKLFQKCLRLRGMDNNYLQRALAMYSE